MEILPLFYIFSSLVSLLSIKLLSAADTITPSSFIRDGEKLASSSERFELGFFSPGKSRYRYLGIWYKQVPDTAVWVANRDSPIFDQNAALTISSNGNLVLLNQTNGTIWSSNTSRQVNNPVAQLLDTGNLVIMANSSRIASESYLWQSFHYPTDTLLQGMKLGWDLKTGLERYQTSWRSADDPSPGNFTNRLDIHVLPEICTYKGSAKFRCTGPWNGIFFGAAPSSVKVLFEPIMVDNEDGIYYSYNAYNSPIIMMLKLQPSGELQRLVWNERSNEWQVFFSAPTHFCHYYGSCGANSFCSFNKTPNCECLKGFKQKSQQNQHLPRTCVRSHSSECKSGDRFMKLDDSKLPDLLEVSLNKSMNLKECEAECLKNCTCIAYANSKVTDGGSGCLMWFGDLIDLRNTLEHNGQPIYIRVPATKLGNKKLLWILIVFLPVVLLLAFYIFFRWRTKHKETETKTSQDLVLFDINMSTPARENEFYKGDKGESSKSGDSWFPIFSLASVSAATNNFSEENKLGEGGFGPVYKGQLLNGQEVAIKRLSSQSGQGLEEFKNELKLIAKLQHRNLVRLLGCCIEEGEKVLIYEYMSNKSLDLFLFDPTKEGLLNWGTRVRIIEGIAQGLLYLHQYSRLRVIHRDLKASNILLDGDMNPKISDFGMARMFGEDELQLNTKRIVGTYGYMSPEYALHGRFSIKSDVFSFGVLLLEILTSKRNTGFHKTNSLTLIGHTWAMWKDDRAWELMDPVLQHEASYLIVMRYINVALLCVQEDAAYRPTMSEVVSMLTNEMLNLPSPQQPAFSSLKNSDLHSNTENEACSLNFLTISVVDAR